MDIEVDGEVGVDEPDKVRFIGSRVERILAISRSGFRGLLARVASQTFSMLSLTCNHAGMSYCNPDVGLFDMVVVVVDSAVAWGVSRMLSPISLSAFDALSESTTCY